MDKEVNKWRVSANEGTISGNVFGTRGVLTVNGVELTEWAKRIEVLEKEIELLKLKIGE